jgi:hypothetical protein
MIAAAISLLAVPSSGGVLAQNAEQARHPPIAEAAPLQDSPPRATVILADYCHSDLLWENDKTAYRDYGRPLESAEPPFGVRIDGWGKSVA